MRRGSQKAKKTKCGRARAGRARVRGSQVTPKPPARSTDHGEVVADMFRCERELTVMLGRVRDRLDAELIAAGADQTPFKDVAFEIQRRLDLPTTADELDRLSRV